MITPVGSWEIVDVFLTQNFDVQESGLDNKISTTQLFFRIKLVRVRHVGTIIAVVGLSRGRVCWAYNTHPLGKCLRSWLSNIQIVDVCLQFGTHLLQISILLRHPKPSHPPKNTFFKDGPPRFFQIQSFWVASDK